MCVLYVCILCVYIMCVYYVRILCVHTSVAKYALSATTDMTVVGSVILDSTARIRPSSLRHSTATAPWDTAYRDCGPHKRCQGQKVMYSVTFTVQLQIT